MRPLIQQAFTKPTAFRIDAPPQAREVRLVIRSIKGGAASAHRMKKGIDGVWNIILELAPGRYAYQFLVDQVPTLDPAGRGTVQDDESGTCSMREVSH
jgi:1,4-alpha-glucan branching enzyme